MLLIIIATNRFIAAPIAEMLSVQHLIATELAMSGGRYTGGVDGAPSFPALSAIEEGYDVFVITDASGTFNEVTRHSAWLRMQAAGVQMINWFGMACELHRDWRNDIEGLGTLFSNHIPNYRNLMTSYLTLTRK